MSRHMFPLDIYFVSKPLVEESVNYEKGEHDELP
jgi:hypothetical protein